MRFKRTTPINDLWYETNQFLRKVKRSLSALISTSMHVLYTKVLVLAKPWCGSQTCGFDTVLISTQKIIP